MSYAKHVSRKITPQSESIPGRIMVPNSAGGFAFPVDNWKRLERFLILGNEGGSYYATEKKLTKENATCVENCAREDFDKALNTVVSISVAGRAPKNSPAIFALALLSCDPNPENRRKALDKMPEVCRIGTHLFEFVECCKHLRGRGRALHRTLQKWYNEKSLWALSYQVTKYQQRNNWTHRDILRLCKPKTDDFSRNKVYRWIVGKEDIQVVEFPGDVNRLLEAIFGLELAKKATSSKEVAKIVRDYKLVRECVPTEHLNSSEVWEALLENMPMTAMVRNLGKMSSIGLLTPMSSPVRTVVERLRDKKRLKDSRLHPLQILLALTTYRSGKGVKGSLSWSVDSSVVCALDSAFYDSFEFVEPTNKRYYLGIDVSGSMGWSMITNTHISCREAAAAMAMVTVRTEPMTYSAGFCDHMQPLSLSRIDSLVDAVKRTSNLRFGGTDCSLPMLDALHKKIEADVFVVLTDNETWAGNVHPIQALEQYRQRTGIPAKLIVIGMVSNGFTIADPNDAGCLDVVGFDASVPSVMADFARN